MGNHKSHNCKNKSHMLSLVVVEQHCCQSAWPAVTAARPSQREGICSCSCCLPHLNQTQISLIGRHAYIELAARDLDDGGCLLKFISCASLTLAGFITVPAANDVTALKASCCPDVCHLLQDCLQCICWAHKFICLPSNHEHLCKRESCHHP